MISGDAEVMTVGDRSKGNAELSRSLDRRIDRKRACREGKTERRIDKCRSTLAAHDRRSRVAIGTAVTQMRSVLRDARYTVRDETLCVGVDEGLCRCGGHFRMRAGIHKRACCKIGQRVDRERRHRAIIALPSSCRVTQYGCFDAANPNE